MSKIQPDSSEGIFIFSLSHHSLRLAWNYFLPKIPFKFPGGQWVNSLSMGIRTKRLLMTFLHRFPFVKVMESSVKCFSVVKLKVSEHRFESGLAWCRTGDRTYQTDDQLAWCIYAYIHQQGPVSIWIGIPIIKIRWSHDHLIFMMGMWDHLIFMMGIPIPGKASFILKRVPGLIDVWTKWRTFCRWQMHVFWYSIHGFLRVPLTISMHWFW